MKNTFSCSFANIIELITGHIFDKNGNKLNPNQVHFGSCLHGSLKKPKSVSKRSCESLSWHSVIGVVVDL